MSDLERDLEDLGRRIWPDPERVRSRACPRTPDRVTAGGAASTGLCGSLLGTGVAMALIGSVSAVAILQVQHHLAASPGATRPAAGPATVGAGRTSGGGEPVVGVGADEPGATGRLSPSPVSLPSPSPTAQPPPAGGTLTLTQSSRGHVCGETQA